MIVKLQCGLGNQMFQYAFGRALAASGKEVFFDRTDCDRPGNRVYQLDAWNLPSMNFKAGEADHQIYQEDGGFVGKYLPDTFDQPDNTYYRGFWQTERYFAHIADDIRQAFLAHAAQIPDEIREYREQIINSKSAFISVRRDDYTSKGLNRLFGCMNHNWYVTARRHIEETVGWDTKFFVFSDDPVFCRAHFGGATVIDTHRIATRERIWPMASWHLYLMSLCDHAVISNSSFAWWGAWLNPKQDRVVIAPDPWFRGLESSGVVPARWLKQKATILP